jgi:threonine dehydrogenase-like Zn-dependent dehydrogenase
MARDQNAEIVDFSREDPVETLKGLTGGIGADRVIDAVGVDAVSGNQGAVTDVAKDISKKAKPDLRKVAPITNEQGDNWHPGDSPSQALLWEVESIAKAGTLSVIGVYPQTVNTFPIGAAMNKNLTVRMGNCNHRRYIPMLVNMVRAGVVDPTEILTQREPITAAIDAYKEFDRRMPGWIKVMLEPAKAA